jgi:hypothetical protein
MDRMPGTMFTQAASDSSTSVRAILAAASASGAALNTTKKSL